MDIVSSLIPAPWLALLWLLAAALGLVLARRAQWRMLADSANLQVFLAASVVVLALWLIKTGIKPGLSFHLLGATALTLMFRPLFALFALALVTAATTLWSGEYAAFAANWLVMGAVPVAVTWLIFRLVDSKLPNHLFIYLFLNAFFGAAASIMAVGAVSTALIATFGAYPLAYLLEEYLPYYLLMGWSEAFITGMLVTMMVIYKPHWVSTFDDRRYLSDKSSSG